MRYCEDMEKVSLQRVKEFRGRLLERDVIVDPGVVDQNVEPTGMPPRTLNRFGARCSWCSALMKITAPAPRNFAASASPRSQLRSTTLPGHLHQETTRTGRPIPEAPR
jgi:hypothetical protein